MNDPTAQFPSVVPVSRTMPVAYLPHRCMICDGTIAVGERHHRWVWRMTQALDRHKAIKTARFHCKCPEGSEANGY